MKPISKPGMTNVTRSEGIVSSFQLTLIEKESSSISQSGGSRFGGIDSVGAADTCEGSGVRASDGNGGGLLVAVRVLGIEVEQAAAIRRAAHMHIDFVLRIKVPLLDSIVRSES